MKNEYKIIIFYLIMAVILSFVVFNRMNEAAQPDEFDREIAKIKGEEAKPNFEQWIVYLLTAISFISIISVGFINSYFYKQKNDQIKKGIYNEKINKFKIEGGFITVILSGILWMIYGVIWDSTNHGNTLFNVKADPNPPDLFPLLILFVIINMLIIICLYWITKKRIGKIN